MGYRHIPNLYKSKDILLFRQCYALEKIHGCLHKDTLIAAVGGYICIKDIQEGDKVFCYNESDKTFEVKKVIQKFIRPAAGKWVSITLENKKKLIITEDHLVLTNNNGWVKAKDLKNDDEIIEI